MLVNGKLYYAKQFYNVKTIVTELIKSIYALIYIYKFNNNNMRLLNSTFNGKVY